MAHARFAAQEHVGVRGGDVEGGCVLVLRTRQACRKDQFNRLTKTCSGSEAGSYLRLVDFCMRIGVRGGDVEGGCVLVLRTRQACNKDQLKKLGHVRLITMASPRL